MPYIGTIGFHTIQALLAFLSILYLLLQRQNFHISPLKKYFTWFVFFTFYNIALIISALIYDSNPFLSALGYQVGLALLAIGAWQAFLVALGFLNIPSNIKRILAIFYILGAFSAVALHSVFFEMPQALNTNWLLWYSNQIVALPYILFMFLAGWTFSFAFARVLFSKSHTFLKVRALLMSVSGFILPFAAFFYFAASKISHIYVSFGVVIAGMILFAFANIGVGILRKRER